MLAFFYPPTFPPDYGQRSSIQVPLELNKNIFPFIVHSSKLSQNVKMIIDL